MQPRPARNLPTNPARVEFARVELAEGAWVVFEPGWLDESAAHCLLQSLLSDVAWQQGSIRIFGRQVLEPRLIAWAGELPYRYSGRTLPPAPRPACLDEVWRRAEAFAGVSFNHLLLNRYRNGDDSMGWHSDDEPELGECPPILSLSLGATRRFLLKPKAQRPPEPTRTWSLTHGALLFMGGSTQHDYRHSVPRQRGAGERVNLTFRRITCAPAQ